MTWRAPLAAALFAGLPLVSPSVAAAQDDTAPQPQPITPEEAARQTPIIVEGSRAEDEKKVTAGSRIAQKIRRKPTGIATDTGIGGLTPGSGMEPLNLSNGTRTLISTSCVSDNEEMGERASCLFLEAQGLLDEKAIDEAADIYRVLVSSQDFNAEERLMGGTQLYNLAASSGDEGMREEALIRLLDSGALPPQRTPSARRNLAQMALARGDKQLAIRRLEEHVAITDDDPASWANLAILRRDVGRTDTREPMQRAIALKEATGGDVPQGWRDFVAMNNAAL